MEKQVKFYLTLPFVAMVTLALLSVPFIAMQFTTDVRWSFTDFVIAGALIFGAGSVLVVVMRSATHIAYRAAMIIAVGTTLLMVWANLAVGLIGSGPNAGNLMYGAVLFVLLAGLYLSKFKPAGAERAMFTTALSVILVGAIALMLNLQNLPGSSVPEIVGVSLFFTVPYIVAGLLFRFVATGHAAAN